MAGMTDHYELLGVEPDATKDEIKAAYRSEVEGADSCATGAAQPGRGTCSRTRCSGSATTSSCGGRATTSGRRGRRMRRRSCRRAGTTGARRGPESKVARGRTAVEQRVGSRTARASKAAADDVDDATRGAGRSRSPRSSSPRACTSRPKPSPQLRDRCSTSRSCSVDLRPRRVSSSIPWCSRTSTRSRPTGSTRSDQADRQARQGRRARPRTTKSKANDQRRRGEEEATTPRREADAQAAEAERRRSPRRADKQITKLQNEARRRPGRADRHDVPAARTLLLVLALLYTRAVPRS